MEIPKLFLTVTCRVAGFVSLMGPLGEVIGYTCCYGVYLVHVELMQTSHFLAGSFRWINIATKAKIDILCLLSILHYPMLIKDQRTKVMS